MKYRLFIYLIFFIAAITMLGLIISSVDKIRSDIGSLVLLKLDQSVVLENIQKRNSNNILFLSSNLALLDSFAKNPLFKEFLLKYNDTSSFKDILKVSSLATMNYETYMQIIDNPDGFFAANAMDLYNPFAFRVVDSDFLNYSSYSTLLLPSNLTFDLKTQTLKIDDNGSILYFANAVLRDDFKSSELIDFYINAKESAKYNGDRLFITGSEIFAGFAKKEGDKESLIMGSFSLLFIAILLFGAFGNWRILKLIIIIVFSFLCGLSGAFLIFDYISLFSIVISISLIGLILDFAMHFLGYTQNRSIQKDDIKGFLRIFLIGLLITTLGYGLFILAPIGFLKEIAIISIFSLIGAFLATYFLLPNILENHTFKSHKLFDKYLDNFISFNIYILKFKRLILTFIAIIVIVSSIFLIYTLPKFNFNDDIRNYSALNLNLINETNEFVKITKMPLQSSFIVLRFNPNEDKIAKERSMLKDLNITNYYGSSRILLSMKEQNYLKEELKIYAKDSKLLQNYINLGIDAKLVQNSLKSLASLDSLSFDEFYSLFKDTKNPLSSFKFDYDTNLIFIDSANLPANIDEILNKYNAYYINLTDIISQNFTQAKHYAIVLKFIAYGAAFIILLLFFGFVRACAMMGIVLFATFISIVLLIAFGVNFNIFTIFGFILASTIGVDYALFALNQNLDLRERYFGILLASLTSIISFGMLGFSATYAVFSFGIATALCMLLSAYFALLYATVNFKK